MAERLDEVELAAPAKINLRLRVLERMESGYHALESVFCAVDLCDVVRVRRGAPGVRLRVEGGDDIGPPARNLVVRAAARFAAAAGLSAAVEIELEKRIPAAAGLGGGSSDAAATLRALNALHGAPLGAAALLDLGAEIGSDVPFFLAGSALALGWGRGERLLALPPLPPLPVLIAHPRVPMPTGEAFARLAAARAGGGAGGAVVAGARAQALTLGELADWDAVAGLAANDFDAVAVERIPVLGEVRRLMRDAGAVIAMLSGSGAAYFGVFADDPARDAAHDAVRGLGLDVWRARTLKRLPDPTAVGGSG